MEMINENSRTFELPIKKTEETENLSLQSTAQPQKESLFTASTEAKMAEWVYESKNGIMRINPAKLANHMRNNAAYFYVQFADRQKKWYKYDEEKHVYVNVTVDEFKGFIKSFVPAEAENPGDINKVFANLSSDGIESPHKVLENELNGDENIINFMNGVYNIEERKLMRPSSEHKSTLQIQCEYKPVNECVNNGVFDKFIDHFFNGDKRQIELMLQIIGLVISNRDATKSKQAIFLVGDGNTGKSLFKKLVARLIGESFNSSIDLKTLETRFGKSSLYQKRIAGSNDMSFEYIKNLTTFKNVTGGDSITTEFKGQNYFEMTFRGLLWFCCNEMPLFGGDKGDWVYKRICIMKALGRVYDKNDKIPEDETNIVYRNEHLIDELWEEREYIVSRAIEALYKYIDNGEKFCTTELNDEYLEEYKAKNSSIAAFLDICCTDRTKIDGCSTSKMYAVYAKWCSDSKRNKDKMSKIDFRKELSRLGKGNIKTVNGNRYYSDITLSNEAIIEYGYIINKCS